MYKALVCCRAGMGTSMLLKIKADQVIKENDLPIQTEHGSLNSLLSFEGDLVITLNDLSEQIRSRAPFVVGVDNALDKEALLKQFKEFLAWEEKKGSR